MIGFIKWLIAQYKIYKLHKILEPSIYELDRISMDNYLACIEAGFTGEQILALMHLLNCVRR